MRKSLAYEHSRVPGGSKGSWFGFPRFGLHVRFVLAHGMHNRPAMAGLRSPEEFDAWQLAWELKERVYAFTAAQPAADDRKFCSEIRESVRSAPDNISEGFYRFNPGDFANFVRMARGSLGEVRNQLKHAHSKGYLSDAEFEESFRLCRRAMGATTALRLYLMSLPKNFDPRKVDPSTSDRKSDRKRNGKKPSAEPEPGTLGTRNSQGRNPRNPESS
jgi:four helix bundle protein